MLKRVREGKKISNIKALTIHWQAVSINSPQRRSRSGWCRVWSIQLLNLHTIVLMRPKTLSEFLEQKFMHFELAFFCSTSIHGLDIVPKIDSLNIWEIYNKWETHLDKSIMYSSKVCFFGSSLIEALAFSIASLENGDGLGPHFWEGRGTFSSSAKAKEDTRDGAESGGELTIGALGGTHGRGTFAVLSPKTWTVLNGCSRSHRAGSMALSGGWK